MNKEHEQGIRAFENCLQSCKNLGHELFEEKLPHSRDFSRELGSFSSKA